MTYSDLLHHLKKLGRDELAQDVTVHLTGIVELYSVSNVRVVVEDNPISDVIDIGSIVLEVDDGN